MVTSRGRSYFLFVEKPAHPFVSSMTQLEWQAGRQEARSPNLGYDCNAHQTAGTADVPQKTDDNSQDAISALTTMSPISLGRTHWS
jgi:hypothetical protein